jgi:3-carboxy-cis,cis-muconate cycloisomerase
VDENVTTCWFDPLFRTEAMRRVFSDVARLQGMLDFEAALARALAAVGIISSSAAETIASQCRAELFDLANLSRASAAAGNSAIPIIHELERLVAKESPEVARYVHFGATSQDAIDTGLMLQVRDAFDVMSWDFEFLCNALEGLSSKYKRTPLAGRTWLQHAAPTTFGLKVAGWLSALTHHRERLGQLRSEGVVLQLGGPVGTLAPYGDQGEKIVALVAQELHLSRTDLPWHAHRERLVEMAMALGLLTGTLGKMARDISLLSQSEIGEVAEPPTAGRGTSSSMPHKHNPVGCAVVLAAATRVPPLVSTMLGVMPQEHERGLGGWQAEWETLPEIFELTAGALAQTRQIIAGLGVYAERMQANIDASRGLLFAEAVAVALTQRIGRSAAHSLIERTCRRAVEERRNLHDIIAADQEITCVVSVEELNCLFDPERHVNAAARLVDKVLERVRLLSQKELSH